MNEIGMQTFDLAGIPFPFSWRGSPAHWALTPDASLCIRSGPNTDFFNDPATGSRVASAPFACTEITEPSFLLSAQVAVEPKTTFDAGLIFVRVADDVWAKFCVEQSPAGLPTIVSVVTRGVSDDCNSVSLSAPSAYLRVAKTRRTLAFHYSTDGLYWHLARYFSLGAPDRLEIGWVAQSPLGEGCAVRFSDFRYRTGELAQLRDGQ